MLQFDSCVMSHLLTGFGLLTSILQCCHIAVGGPGPPHLAPSKNLSRPAQFSACASAAACLKLCSTFLLLLTLNTPWNNFSAQYFPASCKLYWKKARRITRVSKYCLKNAFLVTALNKTKQNKKKNKTRKTSENFWFAEQKAFPFFYHLTQIHCGPWGIQPPQDFCAGQQARDRFLTFLEWRLWGGNELEWTLDLVSGHVGHSPLFLFYPAD